MKKTIILIILSFTSFFLYAQEDIEIKTIFGDLNSNSQGKYGAFSVRYENIGGLETYVNGGRGGWIFNNITIGMAAYGFDSSPVYDEKLEYDCRLSGGYGGLLIEPIIGKKRAVHLAFPIIAGAGGIAYRKHFRTLQDIDNWRTEDSEIFFVLQAGAELEFNLLRFLKFGIGCWYKKSSNFSLDYDISGQKINTITEDPLDNISVGIIFKFGRF